jgi:hypothetical protein
MAKNYHNGTNIIAKHNTIFQGEEMLELAWPTSSSLDSLSLSVMFVGGFGTGNSTL